MTDLQKQVLLSLARGIKSQAKTHEAHNLAYEELENLLRAVHCLADEVLTIIGERKVDRK